MENNKLWNVRLDNVALCGIKYIFGLFYYIKIVFQFIDNIKLWNVSNILKATR